MLLSNSIRNAVHCYGLLSFAKFSHCIFVLTPPVLVAHIFKGSAVIRANEHARLYRFIIVSYAWYCMVHFFRYIYTPSASMQRWVGILYLNQRSVAAIGTRDVQDGGHSTWNSQCSVFTLYSASIVGHMCMFGSYDISIIWLKLVFVDAFVIICMYTFRDMYMCKDVSLRLYVFTLYCFREVQIGLTILL